MRSIQVQVRWLPRDTGGPKEVSLPDAATGEMLLQTLKLHPDAVLLTRDRTPIPITAPLQDGDRIAVIRVASGG